MKRKIKFILFSIIMITSSCVKSDLDNIRERLTSLEKWQTSVNQEITSLKNILTAMENKDYVTSVTPLEDGSGYVINFVKSGAVTIKHGVKGQDASPPAIGVKKDTNGKYYWTLDGEWLLDEKGNKIPTTGENTAPGHGSSIFVPMIRINKETNKWEISVDNGETWTSTDVNATGPAGPAGPAGPQGPAGPAGGGIGGNSIFSAIDLSAPAKVILTLASDGSLLELPRYTPFTLGEGNNNEPITLIGTATIKLNLPAGLKSSDYSAISARVESPNASGNDIQTKAAPEIHWGVQVVKPTVGANDVCNNDGAVVITPPVEEFGKVAILKVTLIRKDGSELSSSRPLKFSGLVVNDPNGGLSGALGVSPFDIEFLKITGTMGNSDFTAIRSLPNIKGLDLSETTLTEMPFEALRALDNPNVQPTLQKIILPDQITTFGSSVFYDQKALKWVNMPKSLTRIGQAVFTDCHKLEQIELPAGLQSIPYATFWNCKSLEQVIIPNSVTSIGKQAFHYCRALKSIHIPASVTSIGTEAFNYCAALESATIEGPVDFLDHTFIDCHNLKTVVLKGGVKRLEATFYRCKKLERVRDGGNEDYHLPQSITEIGQETFWECESLKAIRFYYDSQISVIGRNAFYSCSSLEFLLMPRLCKTIRDGAFAYCRSLKFIRLDEGLTAIEQKAFMNTGLSTITFPKSLQTIGNSIVSSCYTLEEIIFKGAPPASVHKDAFSWIRNGTVETAGISFLVPEGYKASFESKNWVKYYFASVTGYKVLPSPPYSF